MVNDYIWTYVGTVEKPIPKTNIKIIYKFYSITKEQNKN